ncbi:hypothetical protein ACUV84_031386 [Puccinellia chinampoensis]
MAEACPAYPWQQDGAQPGQKVFMSGGGPGGNCASCHQGMFREPAATVRGEAPGVLQAADIVFAIAEEAQPAAVAAGSAPRGGAYTPEFTTLATKIQEVPLYNNNVYFTRGAIGTAVPRMLADGVLVCQELKMKIALHLAQPYMGKFMAA